MDEVYRLFDRRCRMETALVKLARLRRKAWRFKSVRKSLRKLWSKNLEKALTFLDDSLLPPTSNAVERTNRRHRKMQKTVYRVRTTEHVSQRIATDCLREARAEGRATTSAVLHLTLGPDARRTYTSRTQEEGGLVMTPTDLLIFSGIFGDARQFGQFWTARQTVACFVPAAGAEHGGLPAARPSAPRAAVAWARAAV